MNTPDITSPNYKWIYTYDYAPDSIWEKWRESDEVPEWIEDEADAVAARVIAGTDESEKTSDILNFILLADSHFTYNGTWEDTIASMQALRDRIKIDGIIHLGDLTDGLLPARHTGKIVSNVVADMKKIAQPVYVTPGNHDYNYFKGNPDIYYPDIPQYYVDFPEAKLRLIFIDSFDPREKLRYGYTEYCIHWVESVLRMMPGDYKAIFFSHVPPLKQLHAWSDWIRNSHILMPVIDQYADRVLAFINGHSHCDHIFNDLMNGQFPIVAINCAKCEYFTDYKPKGAEVPYRELNSRLQESFDIMKINTSENEIRFVRFGAGRDKVVRNHKGEWLP